MQNNRVKKSLINILWGGINKIILIIFPFVVKTLIIHKLGNEYLGLNSLFVSVLHILSLSELGIGTAMVYAMYKPINDNNILLINKLLNFYKNIYKIIGIVISLLGFLCMFFLSYLIEGDIPPDVNIYIVYILYLFNTAVSYFLFAYRKSLFEADQRNSIISIVNSVTNIFMYILQILILLYFCDFYLYVLVIPLCTIMNNFISYFLSRKKYPNFKCEGKLEKEEKKKIFLNIFSLFGHSLGTMIIISFDSIVISSILGLKVLSIFSNYNYILSAVGGIVTVCYTSILASVGNSLINESVEKNYTNFKLLHFWNNVFIGGFSICLICLYQPFMKLWVGENNMFDFYIVVLFGVYFYSLYFRRIILTYKEAAGKWKDDFWKPYIGAVINIVTNIILVRNIGVAGALISTIIIMFLIYFVWESHVVCKNIFNKNSKKFILITLFYIVPTTICCTICYYFLTLINIDGWIGFVVKAMICMTIVVLFYSICYYKNIYARIGVNKVICFIKNKREG